MESPPEEKGGPVITPGTAHETSTHPILNQQANAFKLNDEWIAFYSLLSGFPGWRSRPEHWQMLETIRARLSGRQATR